MKHIKHILLLLPILVISLMIAYGAPVYAGEFLNSSDDVTVNETESYDIIDGVREGVLELSTSNGASVAHVVLVQPGAKASFKALIPGYYTSGSTKESRTETANNWTDSSWSWLGVSDMVAQYQNVDDSKTVLAAVNGDFYGSYGRAPNGSVVLEGNKEMAHSSAIMSSTSHRKRAAVWASSKGTQHSAPWYRKACVRHSGSFVTETKTTAVFRIATRFLRKRERSLP